MYLNGVKRLEETPIGETRPMIMQVSPHLTIIRFWLLLHLIIVIITFLIFYISVEITIVQWVALCEHAQIFTPLKLERIQRQRNQSNALAIGFVRLGEEIGFELLALFDR